jgi:hypothetical protein
MSNVCVIWVAWHKVTRPQNILKFRPPSSLDYRTRHGSQSTEIYCLQIYRNLQNFTEIHRQKIIIPKSTEFYRQNIILPKFIDIFFSLGEQLEIPVQLYHPGGAKNKKRTSHLTTEEDERKLIGWLQVRDPNKKKSFLKLVNPAPEGPFRKAPWHGNVQIMKL